MQTIYYSTPNFIRHTGNVVDLDAYRQKLTLSRRDNLAPQLEEEDACWGAPEQGAGPASARLRRGSRRARRALRLDCAASLCVILMTVLFSLRVLAF